MKRKGFTLIELLVVVAIIAMLIAILLPALGKAREEARKVQCMSNMRQLSTAVEMYKSDYAGFYPISWWGVPPIYNWQWLILPYAQAGAAGQAGWTWPEPIPYKVYYQVPSKFKVFQCPVHDEYPYAGNTRYKFPSYGMNRSLGYYKSASQGWSPECVPAGRVEYPSTTVFGWEAYHSVGGVGQPNHNGVTYNWYETYADTKRHNGGSHFIFCDLHVGWVKDPTDDTMTLNAKNDAFEESEGGLFHWRPLQ